MAYIVGTPIITTDTNASDITVALGSHTIDIDNKLILKELIELKKINPSNNIQVNPTPVTINPIIEQKDKIVGIKVKRNNINLIDYLELVRE